MITLHESNITSFPLDNGIGVLSDAIMAHAEEELNGLFEFYMEYDSDGVLIDELQKERIIKAKAQDKLGYQLFRIYRITKHHENDNLVILARHITYDLASNFVEEMIATSMTKKQVMEKIGSETVEPHPFNITSSNNTTRSSTRLYRTNPLQMIAGMDGSALQIWGGQLERDNFHLILHDRRGHDDGVTVTYEKNITGLTAEFDIGSLVTRIFPFVYIEATDDEPERLITVNGKYIDSPRINDYEKIYIEPIDYSYDDKIDIHDKTDAQIRQQLESVASQYFEETDNDKVKASMDVAFAHLWETEEYKHVAPLELVGMGDGVTINHSKLKVDATAIVNYIRYDCIAHVNEEVRLGSVKARLTDSVGKIDAIERKAEQAENNANRAIVSANGKNTTFYGPDEPANGMQVGDLWFELIDGQYNRTYRYDGIEWQLIVDMDSHEAKEQAQQAKDDAQQAIDDAQDAIDQAQESIGKSEDAFDKASEAFEDVESLSEVVDDNTGEISTIKQDVIGLRTSVSDNAGNISNLTQIAEGLETSVEDAEENISTLQQTSESFGVRIEGAEDNISTITQTVDGLETQISDNEGNISNLIQTSSALQTTIEDLESDVSTQITQLTNAINLRVEKDDVINQINISDESILISGSKLILDGNTTVNGDFKLDGSAHIQDASIGTAQIGTIDASKISTGTLVGIDIQGARFYSESHSDFMEVIGGNIRLQQSDNERVEVNSSGLYGYNSRGELRFEANQKLVTSSVFGTSNASVYLAARRNNEARVIDYRDIYGDGNIDSYRYLPLRSGGIYANFLNYNPGAGSGRNIYVRPLSNGELRVTLSSETNNYQDVRSRGIKTNWVEVNSLHGESNHLQLRPNPGGELRVTVAGDIDNYADVRASGYHGSYLDKRGDGDHLYVRPASGGEIRITARGTTDAYRAIRAAGVMTGVGNTNLYLRATGEIKVIRNSFGDWGSSNSQLTFRPIRARDYITDTSLRENKKNIEIYKEDTLDVFRNSNAYLYNRLNDTNEKKQLGFMLDEIPSITHSENGDSFALYSLTTLIGKGVKDLVHRSDNHDDRLNYLELENQYLKQKIEQLEEKVA